MCRSLVTLNETPFAHLRGSCVESVSASLKPNICRLKCWESSSKIWWPIYLTPRVNGHPSLLHTFLCVYQQRQVSSRLPSLLF